MLYQKITVFENFFFFVEGDVKAKINTLRSYYSKELQQQSQSQKGGAGRADIYQSKWPYFQFITFLQDTVKSRPT